MVSAMHPCDGFFSEATRAFERIARGMPPDCSGAVLDALLANNLITRTLRVMDRDSQGLILRHGYAISPEVRSEWELFLRACDHQALATRAVSIWS